MLECMVVHMIEYVEVYIHEMVGKIPKTVLVKVLVSVQIFCWGFVAKNEEQTLLQYLIDNFKNSINYIASKNSLGKTYHPIIIVLTSWWTVYIFGFGAASIIDLY